MVLSKHSYPPKQGLYSPEFETEACGVGFVAKINGEKSFQVKIPLILSKLLQNLPHPRRWNPYNTRSFENATFRIFEWTLLKKVNKICSPFIGLRY